jgi:hypothetical protein
MTEDQAYRENITEEPGPLISHLTLPFKPDDGAHGKIHPSLIFNLRVVCCQIAAEVDSIDIYRYNTFAFRDGLVFFKFTNILTETQRAAIYDVSIAEVVSVCIRECFIAVDSSLIHMWKQSVRSRLPAVKRVFLKPQLPQQYHHLYSQMESQLALGNMRLLLKLGLSRDRVSDVGLRVYHIDVLDATADVNLAEQYVVTADDHPYADETEK